MTSIRSTLALLLALGLLVACGAEEEASEASSDDTPAAAAPAEAAEADPPAEAEAPAEEPAEEAPTEAATPSADGVMTLAALRTAFADDREGTMGTEVTVTGLFISASSVNGELNNVSLRASREDDFRQSVLCVFGDDTRPESVDATQYSEITVRGTVGEFFDHPSLESCAIVE